MTVERFYSNDNGTYLTSFSPNRGYISGWWQDPSTKYYYYFNPQNFLRVTGSQTINNIKYVFNTRGVLTDTIYWKVVDRINETSKDAYHYEMRNHTTVLPSFTSEKGLTDYIKNELNEVKNQGYKIITSDNFGFTYEKQSLKEDIHQKEISQAYFADGREMSGIPRKISNRLVQNGQDGIRVSLRVKKEVISESITGLAPFVEKNSRN